MSVQDVVIIGAGPAGMSAALQLKRYGIPALLLEHDQPGGLLRNANLVENYPGFPKGVRGGKLVELFARQCKVIGVEITAEEALDVVQTGDLFQIQTSLNTYHSRVLVVASGTAPVTFEPGFIPAEALDRVYYEVFPLLAVRGKRILIVGAGDAAFDYGLNLARHNQVRILNRGEELKCLPLLWERASREKNIDYQPQTRIVEVGKGTGGELQFSCTNPTGEINFSADYLVGALGREPRMDFLSSDLRRQSRQKEEGGVLYFAGDVVNGRFRQTSIAVGDGILAAMKISQYLKENHP